MVNANVGVLAGPRTDLFKLVNLKVLTTFHQQKTWSSLSLSGHASLASFFQFKNQNTIDESNNRHYNGHGHQQYRHNQWIRPLLLCPSIIQLSDNNNQQHQTKRRNHEFDSNFKSSMISDIEKSGISLKELRKTDRKTITKVNKFKSMNTNTKNTNTNTMSTVYNLDLNEESDSSDDDDDWFAAHNLD